MTNPISLLLLDDNPDDRALALRELTRAFPGLRAAEVLDAGGLARALDADGFDLVVTDFQLRWTDGLQVLSAVKDRYPDVPVIMFTNTGNEEIAVEAMKSGLDDYVNKSPKHYFRLPLAARSALERAESRRRAAQLELRLQDTLEHLNVGVFRATTDGQLLEGNTAFLRLLDLPSLSAAQAAFDRLPEIRAEAMARLRGQGRTYEREVRVSQADRRMVYLLLTATSRAVAGQEIIDGLLEDITERRRAEAENQRLLEQVREASTRQRVFLRDVLLSVTEGRLHLCDGPGDLPPRPSDAAPIPLTREDIATLRHRVWDLARSQAFPEERCYELVTAAGETAMNAVVHAGGGQGGVAVHGDTIQVWVEDQGSGIAVENLPQATLERGYTTAGTLGHGFWMMLQTVDRVWLLTGPAGTTVVLEQDRTPPVPLWQRDVST